MRSLTDVRHALPDGEGNVSPRGKEATRALCTACKKHGIVAPLIYSGMEPLSMQTAAVLEREYAVTAFTTTLLDLGNDQQPWFRIREFEELVHAHGVDRDVIAVIGDCLMIGPILTACREYFAVAAEDQCTERQLLPGCAALFRARHCVVLGGPTHSRC